MRTVVDLSTTNGKKDFDFGDIFFTSDKKKSKSWHLFAKADRNIRKSKSDVNKKC